MAKENISISISLNKIDEIRNYLLEKIKQWYLMTEKHEKVF